MTDGFPHFRCLRRRRSSEEHHLKRSDPPARAFEEVLAEHLDALFSTALRLCRGNEADAEDLLQDSALRAFTCFDQLRNSSAARAWLFTILTRTHLNRVRAAGRRAEATSSDLDESAFEAALAEWMPMPSPAEEVERWQLGERLTRALDELPGDLRLAIWLVDVEGFTQREAAGIQDVPEGTIASRLFRARRQLRAMLERPAREARIWRNQ
ncbi:MAG: sigma-70 family RNA polymerase sigma factor [Gemmatimonadales bacterium]